MYKILIKNNEIKLSDEDILFIHTIIPKEIIDYSVNKMKNYSEYLLDYEYLIASGENEDYAKAVETIVVEGNIKKIDNLWKRGNPSFYLEPYTKTEKYINSKKDILNKKVDIPPQINIILEDSLLSSGKVPYIQFTSGRHRFSNLRDSGAFSIPIIIYKEDLYKFQKLKIIS
jgi:hypothetical protein